MLLLKLALITNSLAGGVAGSISLTPGADLHGAGPHTQEAVYIATQLGSSRTEIEAQSPLPAVVPAYGAGKITFATDEGDFTVTITAGMTQAQVINAIVGLATDLVSTTLAGNILTINRLRLGVGSDVYYLYDEPDNGNPGDVNFALGNFDVQTTSSFGGLSVNITNIPLASAVVTTDNPHGLVLGDSVTIAGCNVVQFNATHTVTAANTPTTFETILVNPGVVGTAGTVGKTAATYARGSYGASAALRCTGADQITLGSGATAIVMDGATGKLTVPGLIDPTGLVLSEVSQAAVPAAATEGALFVSDGTAPATIQNALYYKDGAGAVTLLSSGAASAWDGLSGANPALGGDLVTSGHNITALGNNHDLTISTGGGAATATLTIAGMGTGGLVLTAGDNFQWPSAHPNNAGDVLSSDAAGNLSWIAPGGGGVNWDLTSGVAPKLGGPLDVSAEIITTTTVNGDIDLVPNGTGEVKADRRFHAAGAQKVNRTLVTSAAPNHPYTILTGDYLIGVNSTAGSVILTFPDATLAENTNRIFVLKDESGTATVNGIYGQPQVADQMEDVTNGAVQPAGQQVQLVAVNSGSVQVYSDGTTWRLF